MTQENFKAQLTAPLSVVNLRVDPPEKLIGLVPYTSRAMFLEVVDNLKWRMTIRIAPCLKRHPSLTKLSWQFMK